MQIKYISEKPIEGAKVTKADIQRTISTLKRVKLRIEQKESKRDTVIRLYKQGSDFNDIAEWLDVTVRYVERQISEYRRNKRC